MRQYELVERVQRYKPDVNEALLNKAYVYAMQKHGHQRRASGDPYFSHPLEVAAILTEMHLDEATIAVALLHDTIEDTTATRQEIDELFGAGDRQAGRGADQAEEARPRLQEGRAGGEPAQAAAGDLRGRARAPGQARRPAAQHAHARPRAGGQAPAHRRGDDGDLCAARRPHGHAGHARGARGAGLPLHQPGSLPHRHRAAGRSVRAQSKGVIGEIEKALSALFEKHGIKATVKSRQKKPWSVFRKMEAKALSFEQLSDIFGFRVIVGTVEDCYRALGAIHTTWSMVPGRFKDYISTPKQNDYRSIHTTIVGPSQPARRTADPHQAR